MGPRHARRSAAALLLGLLLAGCGVSEAVEAPTADEPTVPTDSVTTPDPTPTATSAAPEPTEAATTEAAATGPQTCGTVTSVIGEEVAVEIVTGEVDCAFAEDLLDTYYNDPPHPPEGSGGFVMIGEWECNSSSSQEPGRASSCHGPDDGLIISVPTGDSESAGAACSLIDQPTLDQIFPDGNYDEDLCQSYIDGENSIGG